MITNLRPSGIHGLGDMSWGTHFCLFYETKEDLLDILIPYFKAGLENHEFCLWVASAPADVEEAWDVLRERVPDFERYVAEGQIEIMSHADWYLSGGTFDPRRVIQAWIDKHDQALAQGYAGLRCMGNTFWLEEDHRDGFAEYEAELDKILGPMRIIVLCTYALERCIAEDVLNIIGQHQFTIARRDGAWEYLQGSELKRAHVEILRLNAELEQRVAERTAELISMNERLRSEVAERKRNEKALLASEARLQAAIDAADIGLWDWDVVSGQITWLGNHDKLFGFAPGEFDGTYSSLEKHVHPEDLNEWNKVVQHARAEGSEFAHQYRVIWSDGSIHWIAGRGRFISNDTGQPVRTYGAVLDITERKLAEEAMRRYAARMEALAEISRTFVEAGLDYQSVLNTVARRTAELIGDSCVITLFSEDGQRSFPVAFHHPDPKAREMMQEALLHTWQGGTDTQRYRTLLSGGAIYIREVIPEEFRASLEPEFLPYLEKVGISSMLIVPLQVQGHVIGTLGITRDQPGRPYTPADQMLLRDLAERAALLIQNARLFRSVNEQRERLRLLSARMAETQELERRRLAREIHDDVSQSLTALVMQLGAARSQLPKSAKELGAILEQTEALAQSTLERTRLMIADLRPSILDELGLIPALRRLGEELYASTGVTVKVKAARLRGRLPPQIEIALFRIVQEALANIRRHAQARHVDISLGQEPGRVALSVQDDGLGFEKQTTRSRESGDMIIDGGWVIPAGHFGLIGIQERVNLLGGSLELTSAPDQGTTLRVELPL